jgi:ribonuclease G
MKQEIIVNKTLHETRLAVLENGVLVEFMSERKGRRSITGNIYKGRVTRVLPGMQASFIDIGLEKDGFLYVLDFLENLENYEALIDGMGEDESDETALLIDDTPAKKRKGEAPAIENLLKPGQEILVQIGKEPIGTKGSRVTSHISLPGRYLV